MPDKPTFSIIKKVGASSVYGEETNKHRKERRCHKPQNTNPPHIKKLAILNPLNCWLMSPHMLSILVSTANAK